MTAPEPAEDDYVPGPPLEHSERAWRVLFSAFYVGSLLRERREAMGWSLPVAVKHSGISRTAIQRLEAGQTSEIEKIQKYAEVLGFRVHLEIEDLYADVPLPASPAE